MVETPQQEIAGDQATNLTGFQIIDHTADVGLRATGDTLAEAFANAAKGMFSIITDLAAIQTRESQRITVSAPDLEALLVNWLNELLYRFEVDGILFADFAVETLDQQRLEATCLGERIDPQRHHINTGVKAATYHQIEVKPGRPSHVQVILDI